MRRTTALLLAIATGVIVVTLAAIFALVQSAGVMI